MHSASESFPDQDPHEYGIQGYTAQKKSPKRFIAQQHEFFDNFVRNCVSDTFYFNWPSCSSTTILPLKSKSLLP
jgi:hypothetical protein